MDVQKAKAIFKRFQGNHFHMNREGQYDVYKSFNISAHQEREWAKETQRDLIEAVSLENDVVEVESLITDLGSMFTVYRNVDEFKELLNVLYLKLALLDSFTVIRCCEEVFKVIKEFQRKNEEPDVFIKGKKFVRNSLRGVLNSTIRVSPKYYNIEYLKETLEEDKLLARANKDLESCDTLNQ